MADTVVVCVVVVFKWIRALFGGESTNSLLFRSLSAFRKLAGILSCRDMLAGEHNFPLCAMPLCGL